MHPPDLRSETEALCGSIDEILRRQAEAERLRAENLRSEAEALFRSIDEILRRQAQSERLRGENFNIFQLLGVQGQEDSHSRFLADLLDPRGSHRQGAAFLDLFQKQVVDEADRLDATRATVEREYRIGPVHIRGEDSTGGIIDIFITDGKKHLSIENKILSGELEKQITCYCNHDPTRHHVLFLTLRGDAADTEKKNYSPISYPDHVLPWLESCQRRAADSPILRETIKQYIIAVKRLTGQLAMSETQNELRKAIESHPAAAAALRHNFDAVARAMVSDLVDAVRDRVADKLGSDSVWAPRCDNDIHRRWGGFGFRRSTDLAVRWEGDDRIAKTSYYGILASAGTPLRSKIDKALATPAGRALGLKVTPKNVQWAGYTSLAEARFETLDGLERLFDRDRRNALAENIAGKLFALIEFCDHALADDPA